MNDSLSNMVWSITVEATSGQTRLTACHGGAGAKAITRPR